MFTPEEIARINHLLSEGVSPEDVGREFGVGLTSLRAKLAQSGYRIQVYRKLETIQAVQPVTVGV